MGLKLCSGLRLEYILGQKKSSSNFFFDRWVWDAAGCAWYGFFALFLGFCQMHVPVLILLDTHFANTDPQYETKKDKKRLILIAVSFLISLFWGITPVFGLPPLNFEPSGLSCSVYDEKGGTLYTMYIICCLFFFEIIPLGLVVYCKAQSKPEHSSSIRVSVLCLNFIERFI